MTTEHQLKLPGITARAETLLARCNNNQALSPDSEGYAVALAAVKAALQEPFLAEQRKSTLATLAANKGLSLVGYGHVMSLGKFFSEGKAADVFIEPSAAYPTGPDANDWMFPLYMGDPIVEVIDAARTCAIEQRSPKVKPYAWENELTGEITKDSEKGFMWEFNKENVVRLYTLGIPTDAPKS